MRASLSHPRAGLGKLLFPMICVISSGLILLLQHGFLLIFMGLLPSGVAYMVDRRRHKPMFKTVLAANMAGMMPYLILLLNPRNGILTFKSLIDNPQVWLIIYGAAAGGYFTLFICRIVSQVCIGMFYTSEANNLEAKQQKLLEEWGPRIKKGLEM